MRHGLPSRPGTDTRAAARPGPAVEAPIGPGAADRPERAFVRLGPAPRRRTTKHPEPDFYTVGMKSYGRAPTFLLLTGLRAGPLGRGCHRRRLGVRAQGRAGAARDGRLQHDSNSDEASSCCSTTPPLISLDLGAPRELQFVRFAPRATQFQSWRAR